MLTLVHCSFRQLCLRADTDQPSLLAIGGWKWWQLTHVSPRMTAKQSHVILLFWAVISLVTCVCGIVYYFLISNITVWWSGKCVGNLSCCCEFEPCRCKFFFFWHLYAKCMGFPLTLVIFFLKKFWQESLDKIGPEKIFRNIFTGTQDCIVIIFGIILKYTCIFHLKN
jgi:hypothetical protein